MSTPGDGRTYRFRCRRPHGRATPSHHRSDSLVRSSTRLRPVLDPSPTSSTPDRRRTQRRSTHAALSLSTRHTSSAVARASRAAKRARERVRGMSESPQATSESAGEGVAQVVSGCHRVVIVTDVPSTYASESARECGYKFCPGVAGRLGHTTTIYVQERIGPRECDRTRARAPPSRLGARLAFSVEHPSKPSD